MADPEFLLLGDALWLDFVNTAATPPGPSDTLTDPAAWLRWTKAVQVEAESSQKAFSQALEFRGRLVALARALDQGRGPAPSVIEAVNTRLKALEGREQLVRIGGSWRLRFAPGRPPSALEAIAQSAAQLLADPLILTRQCANPDCGLYFADDTLNQSRRWCSRTLCGQRGRIERRRGTRITPIVAEG